MSNFPDYKLSIGTPHTAEPYLSPIPRKKLKTLMQRQNKIPLRDYSLWIILLLISAGAVTLAYNAQSWLVIPAMLVYGILYGGAAHSRIHECGHGTPFRTLWLNTLFHHMASFMCLKNLHAWKWSHAKHHTHTIIVAQDPEIAFPRPPNLLAHASNLLNIAAGVAELRRTFNHARGRLSNDEKQYIPADEAPKVFRLARIHLALLGGVVAVSVGAQSWLPLLLVGLPTFYGSWAHHVLSATQHAGLAENAADYRTNTRTIYLNPVVSFIYSNMNYHIEHHMYPLVPYYSLPALHEELKADLPRTYNGLGDAYREMLPALWRQRKDPDYFVSRAVPGAAQG